MGWSECCESISFGFDTAWSPPMAWLKMAVSLFPELEFKLHYEESGGFFAGDVFGNQGFCSVDVYDEARCAELFAWDDEDEPQEECVI